MKGTLIYFVFFSFFVFGQQNQLSGICVDKKGNPIENVFVKISTSPVQDVYTDSKGKYKFLVQIGDSLKIFCQANEITIKKEVYISSGLKIPKDFFSHSCATRCHHNRGKREPI